MDCNKVGQLILSLRKEKGFTQKQLSEILNISDRTISKWERGLGCPDVSLLHELSDFLGVNIEKILAGDLTPNNADGGNMKKIKFYVCPNCGNILTATGEAEISCCGRKLTALSPKYCNEQHHLDIEIVDDDYYITFSHDMSKSHFISFVAYVSCDRVFLVRLYPEQGSEVRIPLLYGGVFYFCCIQHGLFINDKSRTPGGNP